VELRKEGHPFDEKMEVGVMIEVPAAALCAEEIARDVNFMSIGTNDLVQYTLAVDRLNDAVATLYEPTHPAVLRLIRHVVGVAHRADRWVGVCGEMASDIVLVPLLLGLGIDELSSAALLVPRIKRAVQPLDIAALTQKIHELVSKGIQPASPEARREGLTGKLEEFSLPDIVQILSLGLKTAKVEVDGEGGNGMLYIQSGNIVHAAAGKLRGPQAFLELMRWKKGQFCIIHSQITDDINVTTDTSNLLFKAAKHVDRELTA
jgi:hypothetical protein